MNGMFRETTNLTSVDMRNATFTQVTNSHWMFMDTNSELQITISGDVNNRWFLDKIANSNNFEITENQLNVI